MASFLSASLSLSITAPSINRQINFCLLYLLLLIVYICDFLNSEWIIFQTFSSVDKLTSWQSSKFKRLCGEDHQKLGTLTCHFHDRLANFNRILRNPFFFDQEEGISDSVIDIWHDKRTQLIKNEVLYFKDYFIDYLSRRQSMRSF